MTPGPVDIGVPPWRCSWAARERTDPLAATAGPAQRLLLIEVNGPWGRDALRESRFDRYLAGRLDDAADGAGVRLLLVRRPGRHAARAENHRVGAAAVVDLRPGHSAVQWYAVREPRELLDINLLAPLGRNGPQQVALVCTHGRHDLCCALRGRPVADALSHLPGWDAWECSHVGGDRFAANVLLLPDGDLFGRLDAPSAVETVTDYADGRVRLEYHRGRMGSSVVEQAAVHHAARALSEERRDVLRVERTDRLDEHHWAATVVRRTEDAAVDGGEEREQARRAERYQVSLASVWSEPERLTCQSARAGRVLTYQLDGPIKEL